MQDRAKTQQMLKALRGNEIDTSTSIKIDLGVRLFLIVMLEIALTIGFCDIEAGDAHSAGIIAALMSGANLAAAIELGHRIACSALSQIGARIAVPQELHLEPFFHAHQLS